MLLLCAGMVKSGSGWYFNVANALNVMAGGADTRELRERYDLWDVMPSENCNIDPGLTGRLLERLTGDDLAAETFAVKSHKAPLKVLPEFLEDGRIRAVYSLRELTDVALSAWRHGDRTREEEGVGGFGHIGSVEDAVTMALAQHGIAMRWIEFAAAHDGVTLLPYDDLVERPVAVVHRLARVFGLDLSDDLVEHVAHEWVPSGMDSSQRWFVHYDRGTPGGHRDAFEAEQLAAIDDALRGPSDEMLAAYREVAEQQA